MFCSSSHNELKDSINRLKEFGLDFMLIHSLIHESTDMDFPNSDSDDKYIKDFLASFTSLRLLKAEPSLNIAGLEHFKNVTTISIIMSEIRDFSRLYDFNMLEDLQLVDIETNSCSLPFDLLSKLRGFELSSSRKCFQDLSFISNMTELERLALCDMNLNNSDLSILSKLSKLEELVLDENSISDLSPISSFKNLKSLSLDSNGLSSLANLKLSETLEEISISNNDFHSLSALSSYQKLNYISANNNKIDYVWDLKNTPRLKIVEIAENPFTDRFIPDELLDVEFVVAFES